MFIDIFIIRLDTFKGKNLFRYAEIKLTKLFDQCFNDRCRGTVGLIHVECLERWLTESGHTRCELCGHRYATKRVPRHGIFRSLVIWFNTVIATRQVSRKIFYIRLFSMYCWVTFSFVDAAGHIVFGSDNATCFIFVLRLCPSTKDACGKRISGYTMDDHSDATDMLPDPRCLLGVVDHTGKVHQQVPVSQYRT